MITQDPRQFTRRWLLKSGAAAVPAIAGAASPSAARETGPSAVPGSLAQNAPEPEEELVAGNTAFALDLYAAVRQNSAGNLLFSPYSISQALAMAYAGARGETAAQMAETLAFRLDQPALHDAFSDLNSDLVARGNEEEDPENHVTVRALRLANGLWGEQTYPFSDVYSEELQRYYWAGLQLHDLINAPEGVRHQVNGWVAEQTHDRIQEIVPEGAITSDSRLVLANAIWFFGDWETPFDSDKTQDGEFFLTGGATVTVPFMVQQVSLGYGRGDGFQVIELPYAGSGFVFTVVLPDEGRFEAIEAALDSGTLDAAIGTLTDTYVLVYLPRFEFEFGASLAETLRLMGMADAFDPLRADFSGMVERTPPENLYIDVVLHKAFISVDEVGTEAGAATVAIGGDGGGPAEEPREVRIERPFVFTIRDTQTGTLLFLGRMMDPKM